jgi:hypothetical protein
VGARSGVRAKLGAVLRKIILYQKRRAGGDRERFRSERALRDQPQLLRRIPGVRRIVVSLEAEGNDETFDVATELCFDDAQAADTALQSSVGSQALSVLRADIDRLERVDLVEHKLFDTGRPAPFKLMAALKRRPDLTRSDFKTWWLDRHAPFVVAFPELRRYQVNLVEDGPEAFVDGIAEVGFADLAALKRIMSRTDVKDVQQDSQVHTEARYRLFVEEHVLL